MQDIEPLPSHILEHAGGQVRMTGRPDRRWGVVASCDRPAVRTSLQNWVTAYPVELVAALLAVKGPGWVIDEIRRDEDPEYVENDFRHDILGFVPVEKLSGRTVLDFGCGCGASSAVLSRLVPGIRVTGVELLPEQLAAARLRAEVLGLNAEFLLSPSGDRLPRDLGRFDFILFSAVVEHLLPAERRSLLPLVWSHLKPGGVMFINQTPHRWFPVEGHTTGLPLLNYLPDALAARVARRFCRHGHRGEDWGQLLRNGIRGSTEGEILGILREADGVPISLRPLPEMGGTHLELWHRSASCRHAAAPLRRKRNVLRLLGGLTGTTLVPNLSLAIRKQPATR